MPRRFRILILCCAALVVATAAFAADDFYEQQLRAGKADLQASRLPQAADELRIAAFGLLDQPPQLTEALATLAVVQNALGQTTEVARTIDRFMEVERKFATYQGVQIEPAVRTKFEELVMKQVPRQTLAAMPGLSKLSNYEFQRIAALPVAQRMAAYEAGARSEPKNIEWPLALLREASARDAAPDVIRWGTKVLELDATNKDVRASLAHARASRRECKEALAIIKDVDLQLHPEAYADQAFCLAEMSRWKEAGTALANVPDKLKNRADVKQAAQQVARQNDLAKAQAARVAAANAPKPAPKPSTSTTTRPTVPQASSTTASNKPVEVMDSARRLIRDGKYLEAVHQLRPAVQAEPENRALHLALLEAAVLARDWRTAASQVPVVTPLTPGEELYMFYASVALYETGRHDEAKTFMEKARPRMVPSPMVDYYVKAVLGPQRSNTH